MVHREDLIPDRRLQGEDIDLLDNARLAQAIADVAITAATPTNIALFGPWGSGKSSIYTLLEKRVRDRAVPHVRVVRYDAWKYGGRTLKRNFLTSVAAELGLTGDEFDAALRTDARHARLDLGAWLRRNFRSLLVGVWLAIGLAALWACVLAGAQALLDGVDFKTAAAALVAPSGTVFGLALAAVIVGPKVLEGAVVTTSTPPPSDDDEFTDRFRRLLRKAGIGAGGRLIVFVDELDRCEPKDVVATLVDLKTFLDEPQCVFIVAVDRAVVEDALSQVPQAKPVREAEPYYATRGEFFDKIFQHQVSLPPLRARTLTLFAMGLVEEQGEPPRVS